MTTHLLKIFKIHEKLIVTKKIVRFNLFSLNKQIFVDLKIIKRYFIISTLFVM